MKFGFVYLQTVIIVHHFAAELALIGEHVGEVYTFDVLHEVRTTQVLLATEGALESMARVRFGHVLVKVLAAFLNCPTCNKQSIKRVVVVVYQWSINIVKFPLRGCMHYCKARRKLSCPIVTSPWPWIHFWCFMASLSTLW